MDAVLPDLAIVKPHAGPLRCTGPTQTFTEPP